MHPLPLPNWNERLHRRPFHGLGGDPGTDLWSFPKGLSRDGGAGSGSIKWTAKHGSVIASFYNIGTVDGMNDAGLVANTLYLVEADYGDAKALGRPLISVGAWTQYALDNFGTVDGSRGSAQQGALYRRCTRATQWAEGRRSPLARGRFR